MTLQAYNRELTAIRSRSRKTLGISLLLHAVLLVCLLMNRQRASELEGITEITWIDELVPEPVAVAAAAPPMVEIPIPQPTAPDVHEEAEPQVTPPPEPKQHFPRELRRGDSAPRPQSAEVAQDKLNERLVALQRGATVRTPQVSTPITASTVPSLSPATAVEARGSSAPSELQRGQSATPPPVPLHRAPASSRTASRATISTPVTRSSPVPARIDSTLRRTVAGASLVGPVADRALESYEVPDYPDWAERDAVEASVSLFFKVVANGSVKEPVLVQRTSGYKDFDRNAVAAVLRWRFAPLDGAREQWGEITFHYRLQDTETR